MELGEILFWIGWSIWIVAVSFTGFISSLITIFTFGTISTFAVFGWLTLLYSMMLGYDLVKVARNKKKRTIRTWLSYL